MATREIVVITVNGTDYTGFESFSCSASARSPERSFQVRGSVGKAQAQWLADFAAQFNPEDECTITSNGDLMVTGKIQTVEIDAGPDKHELTISGKSKGNDLVKGSADHDTHEERDTNVLKLGKKLDKTGVGITSDETLTTLKKVRIPMGMKTFELLDLHCRNEGLFMCGQPDGTVKITKHGKVRMGGVIEGVNMLHGKSKRSSANRVGQVDVVGQEPVGTGKAATQAKGEAKDPQGGKLKRRVVAQTSINDKLAKMKAEDMVNNRSADDITVNATVQGFRDENGKLWEPGAIVPVISPLINVDEELGIDAIEWNQGEFSVTMLTLVPPEALGGKNKGKAKKAGAAAKPHAKPLWQGKPQ